MQLIEMLSRMRRVAAGLRGQLHHGYSSMQTFHNQRSQPLHCNLQSVLLLIVAIMQSTSVHYTIAFLYIIKVSKNDKCWNFLYCF